MKNRKNVGFTLIELLVVIAIIGVLSAIVLAALGTAKARGNDTSIRSTLNAIKSQAEIYYTFNNSNYGTTGGSSFSSPDNSCDDTNMTAATTMFGAPSTTKGSLLNLLTALKKTATTAKTACATLPITAASPITAWAVSAQLTEKGGTSDFWCVDSKGASKLVVYNSPSIDTPEEAIDQTTLTCR